MNKLRALQYFVAAAGRRSLSGAAREQEVSVSAVAKLLNGLERELGTKLFDRTVHGLTLTAEGEVYLDACRPLLEQLAAADDALKSAVAGPRGTLVVGAPSFVAQHCLVPALPTFIARHPDIQVDLRVVNRVTDASAGAVEVFVLLGWPERGDLVHRQIGQTRLLICAAPSYWAAHGTPQRPRDLEHHPCLLFRNPEGTLLDLWCFQRGGEQETVQAHGWLLSDHRDVLLDAVLAGQGVIRATDLTVRSHLRSGRLVPVLLDWSIGDAPPVSLLYRPNQRRTPRVRLFSDFASALFRELEFERGAVGPAALPGWYRRRYTRTSAALRSGAHGMSRSSR